MDALIATFPAVAEGDLMLSVPHGVAWQADMKARRVAYDDVYAEKFDAYDGQVAAKVNAGRIALVRRHLDRGQTLLDWGAGDGRFVHAGLASGVRASGYEVIPALAARLVNDGVYADNASAFDAVCLWDVLEHLEDPSAALSRVRIGSLLFLSLPVFCELAEIRASRHYRPGEHLYYFTVRGLLAWLALQGFRLLEESAHEMDAGRSAIGAFAFVRTHRLDCLND